MDKRIFKFQEPDREDGMPGRHLEFTDVTFSPLSYSELRDAKLSQPMTIPLLARGAKIVSSDIDGLGVNQIGEIRTSLVTSFTSKAIGLVNGGWLPSTLALRDDTIVLPDRCVVTKLYARLQNGGERGQGNKDFMDLFSGQAVRINPMLFALEGNARQNPTADIARQQLEEAVAKIRSALPTAILIADESVLKGVLGLVQDTHPVMMRGQDFLLHLNPRLTSPIGKRDIQANWDNVLALAKNFGLPKHSPVVIAALSTIIVPNGRSPARRLLKFREGYTRQDAYNALADLRALQI
jgi:hypothetical protein